ncbi:MAG TPA: hypothetical protein DDW50_11210, partial [Firmicutes bacterium]|nr:hypothetical protein [Bacillota bacterium]
GLGIIIGANLGVSGNPHFEKQIEHLEQTYQKIRDDQKILQTSLQVKDNEIDIANQFQKAIVPNLITNRLVGKRIAIIRTNTSVDFKYARQLFNILHQGGADVTSITTFNKTINLTDIQLKNEIKEAFEFTKSDDKSLNSLLFSKLAKIIVNGQSNSQLIFMQNKDLIQLWGDYNRGYVDTIIFLGGGMNPESDHQTDIDGPLLDAFYDIKIARIGVEPSFVTQSYMHLYQSKCQGTVDNIDTAPGEVTLVYLLASGKKGFYGVKDTARSFIPEFKLNY